MTKCELIDGRHLEMVMDGMAYLPREHAIMDHPMVAKMHREMAAKNPPVGRPSPDDRSA
jgi:hypothetical protein